LFVFVFLLKFSPEVLALDINIPRTKIIPLPSGIFNTPTPTPTAEPTAAPTPTPTFEPTATPTKTTFTSPTPQLTPTPQISPLPTPTAPSNIWQLTTIALAAAIVGGAIAALVLKKSGKKEKEDK